MWGVGSVEKYGGWGVGVWKCVWGVGRGVEWVLGWGQRVLGWESKGRNVGQSGGGEKGGVTIWGPNPPTDLNFPDPLTPILSTPRFLAATRISLF